jgi:SAM-dependent methyltransferase
MPAEAPGGGRDAYKRFYAWLLARTGGRGGREMERYKQHLLGGLRGYVLEIGPGAGSNLRYLPDDVYWIGVEPNAHFRPYLEREARRLGRFIEVRAGRAERLPVPDASVDAVVSSHVLCSVDDVAGALREVKRVLKPGGRFVFLEHVAAAPESRQHRLQTLVRPLWTVLADGCHPDRDTLAAIRAAGFGRAHAETFSLPLPVVGPHIAGSATR